jgi:hypothetical protein
MTHATPSSRTPAAPLPSDADRVRARLMSRSLMQLLDRVRGSREVLPHLAALERGLLDHGLSAIGRIPPHWLPRICSQLSSLPLPEQDPPLHDLLDRLLSTMRAQHDDVATVFDAERTVVIREISQSEFDAAAAEIATTQAGQP